MAEAKKTEDKAPAPAKAAATKWLCVSEIHGWSNDGEPFHFIVGKEYEGAVASWAVDKYPDYFERV